MDGVLAATGAPYREPAGRTLAELYRRHWSFVARSVRGMGVPSEAAEDVAQDVFLVARRRLAGFEGRSSAQTWLFGIARRVAKDHRRGRARYLERLGRLPVPSQAPGPEDLIARHRAKARVMKAVSSLDPRKRAVYELAVFDGMTAPEISRRLGVGCNTVYSRLRLARAEIAASLSENDTVRAAN